MARAKTMVAANAALQREMEQRMRAEEGEARFAAILRATTDFVGIATPLGRVLYLNRAARMLTGVEEEADVTQSSIANYYTQESLERIRVEVFPAVRRDGVWTGDTTVLDHTGKEIAVSQVTLAHHGPDGAVKYLSSVMRDITDVKERERKLSESEEKFRQMADNIHDVF